MPEQAFLLLLSLAVVVGAICAAAWLMVTNQVGTVDGLFLICSSMVVAFAFGLYSRWMLLLAVLPSPRGLAVLPSPRGSDSPRRQP